MMNRRNLTAIVLTSFIMISLLALAVPIRSSIESLGYDPWIDLNDDGKIDILESIIIGNHFLDSGEPINKTVLLYNVNDTFTGLLSRIDSLNTSLAELQAEIAGLNATNLMPLIDDLNASLTELRSTVININSTLESKIGVLNTNITQLQSQVESINNTLSLRISTLEAQVATMNTTIVTMNATIAGLENSNAMLNASLVAQSSRIDSLNDTISFLINARNNTLVMVWDSGWYGPTIVGDTLMSYGKTLNISNVVVYMYGKTTLTGDPHQIDYGGYVDWPNYNGAYWWKLTSTSITFHRHGNDANWVYVRITIWQRIVL